MQNSIKKLLPQNERGQKVKLEMTLHWKKNIRLVKTTNGKNLRNLTTPKSVISSHNTSEVPLSPFFHPLSLLGTPYKPWVFYVISRKLHRKFWQSDQPLIFWSALWTFNKWFLMKWVILSKIAQNVQLLCNYVRSFSFRIYKCVMFSWINSWINFLKF